MPRRSILLTLVFAMLGTSIGVALAALRPQPPDLVLQQPTPSPSVSSPAPALDVAHIDPLPLVDLIALPSAPPARPPTQPGPDIAAVQQRLIELMYYAGPINGNRGFATRTALMAFQKVNGLRADGVVGPQTLAALANPTTPTLRGGPPNRVEVDLTKQVLYYVESGQLTRIMPVSSGSGSRYRTKDGSIARSLTPVGTFRVERRIGGVREADLGTLYDPMYFYKGWALHGSNSVPAYPASHGCIRLTRADALWLFGRLPVGSAVIVYGGTHVFPAGSNAAGTDTPAGDTLADAPSPSSPSESGSEADEDDETPRKSDSESEPVPDREDGSR